MSVPIETLPTELLVTILKTVPIRDLLLSQRVCKQWRDVIVNTSELQEALFLKPSSGPFPGWKRTYTPLARNFVSGRRDPTSGFTFQSVRVQGISAGLVRLKGDKGPPRPSFDELGRDEVAERFQDAVRGEGGLADPEGWSCSSTETDKVAYAEMNYVQGELNPFFWTEDTSLNVFREPSVDDFAWHASSCELHTELRDGVIETYRGFRARMLSYGPDASWRRMYITQPPVKRLWVYKSFGSQAARQDRFCYWGTSGLRASEPEITMGDMVARLKGHDFQHGSYTYLFRLEGMLCPTPAQVKLLSQALSSEILEESLKRTGVIKTLDTTSGRGCIVPDGFETDINFSTSELLADYALEKLVSQKFRYLKYSSNGHVIAKSIARQHKMAPGHETDEDGAWSSDSQGDSESNEEEDSGESEWELTLEDL